jgi:sugar phosphate isomerase/epimerase
MSHPKAVSAPLSRRRFLNLARVATAIVAARGVVDGALLPAARAATPVMKGKYPIGIELYSVRGELVKDLPGTLKKIAEIGYEAVEFYSPYFAWTFPYAKQVRTMIDDLGLRCYSTHNQFASFTPGETMAKAIELNQILGARCVVLASAPPGTTGAEGWKQLCRNISRAVGELAKHGLSAGFHNHRTEWAAVDGETRIMDIIAANTPQEFVLQLDVGTCMEAKADPVAWINAHRGRIKSVHLKDWAPGTHEEGKGYRVLFGEGVSPWKEIFAAVESTGGVEYYLMEQEGSRFPEFETAARCLETWKGMRG